MKVVVANTSISYSLKALEKQCSYLIITWKNHRFSVVYRGYEMRTFAKNGLGQKACVKFQKVLWKLEPDTFKFTVAFSIVFAKSLTEVTLKKKSQQIINIPQKILFVMFFCATLLWIRILKKVLPKWVNCSIVSMDWWYLQYLFTNVLISLVAAFAAAMFEWYLSNLDAQLRLFRHLLYYPMSCVTVNINMIVYSS